MGSYNFQVMLARNGLEAVQMAKQHQPHLILMDIQMPQMDGLEATRQIRADTKTHSIPIIALTALVMPGDLERCLEAGANHYLAKPIKLKQLLEMIAQQLSKTDN
nr:response regulator [Nostoc sp. JL31]